jgi:hypothetical protein
MSPILPETGPLRRTLVPRFEAALIAFGRREIKGIQRFPKIVLMARLRSVLCGTFGKARLPEVAPIENACIRKRARVAKRREFASRRDLTRPPRTEHITLRPDAKI